MWEIISSFLFFVSFTILGIALWGWLYSKCTPPEEQARAAREMYIPQEEYEELERKQKEKYERLREEIRRDSRIRHEQKLREIAASGGRRYHSPTSAIKRTNEYEECEFDDLGDCEVHEDEDHCDR